MARKIPAAAKNKVESSKASISTPVRNSAIPKPVAATAKKPVEIAPERIAKRAYEIYLSGTGGSEQDNWLRAEQELRGAL
jgi:hypothetical protein